MKREKIILTFIVLSAFLLCVSCIDNASQSATGNALNSEAQAILVIYETDMTLDVDDVGALAVLHGLQIEGKVKLLGVCYNEVHPAGVPTIDAINTYYGHGDLPIGIYQKELTDPDPSDYFSVERDFDVDNMAHDPMDNIVGNAVNVYKYLLKDQPDNSVTIVSVGFLNNLYELLQDKEGYALVEKKVKLLAIMGGLHNDGFNLSRHDLVDQSQYVFENWPGKLVTTHVGGDMITGETLTSMTPINNPVRRAFELEWYQGPNVGRSSWDEVTVLYAVYGTKYYNEDWEGNGSLRNGYIWKFRKDYRGYAEPKNNKVVEDEIERLMTLLP